MTRSESNMSYVRTLLVLAFVGLLSALPTSANTVSIATDGVDDATRSKLVGAVRKELDKLTDSKNADGKKDKRANYSKFFQKNDDGTYVGSAHVTTAGQTSLATHRYELQLAPKGDGFEVAESNVVGSFDGLHRARGATCYNFEGFRLSREGLTVSGNKGGVCEGYYQGEVNYFALMASDLEYDYQIPEHVNILQESHDFYALKDIISEDHKDVFFSKPKVVVVRCDPATCEELLDSSFTGLNRVSPDERTTDDVGVATVYEPLRREAEENIREREKNRRENPFRGFGRPVEIGNRFYSVDVQKNDSQGLGIAYDNWGGYEVRFFV